MRRTVSQTFIVGAVLALFIHVAQAISFGLVVGSNTLGHPLSMSVPIKLDSDDSLTRDCVTVEVLAGEQAVPAGRVQVSLGPGRDVNEMTLRVFTTDPMNEPVATINAAVGCSAQVQRSFVVFLDPPAVPDADNSVPLVFAPNVEPTTLFTLDASAQVSSGGAVAMSRAAPSRAAASVPTPSPKPVAEVQRKVAESAPAKRATKAQAPAEAPEQADHANRTAHEHRHRQAAEAPPKVVAKKVKPAHRVADKPSPAASAASAPRAASAAQEAPAAASAPVAARSRLRLESVEASLAAPVSVPASEPASSASSVRAGGVAVSEAASEVVDERVQILQADLARLKQEAKVSQDALAHMRERERELSGSRYGKLLNYGLLTLVGVLILALVMLLRQRVRGGAGAWWTEAGPRTVLDSEAAALFANSARAPLITRQGGETVDTGPAAFSPTVAEEPEPDAPAQPVAGASATPSTQVPQHPLTAEDLLDLQQQIEFLLVLGQEDAVVELLTQQLRGTGAECPLPYLSVLDIYRRRDQREPFEEVARAYRLRFHARVADWSDGAAAGRTLEDDPDVLRYLQSLWDQPARVMAVINTLLLPGNSAVRMFELPAYRDLLLLYSIARERLAQNVVDLPLPLCDGETDGERTVVLRPRPAA